MLQGTGLTRKKQTFAHGPVSNPNTVFWLASIAAFALWAPRPKGFGRGGGEAEKKGAWQSCCADRPWAEVPTSQL